VKFRQRAAKRRQVEVSNLAFVRGNPYRLILVLGRTVANSLIRILVWTASVYLFCSLLLHIENVLWPVFIGVTGGELGVVRILLVKLIEQESADAQKRPAEAGTILSSGTMELRPPILTLT
jgi:hypothetical protein